VRLGVIAGTRAADNHLAPVFVSLSTGSKSHAVSVPTLRDKIATGELRAFRFSDKPGSAIRVRVGDLDALFKPVIPDEVYAADDRRPRRRNGDSEQLLGDRVMTWVSEGRGRG